MTESLRQPVFLIALALCFFPFISPPIALAMGLVIALTLGHPYAKYNSKATKILLQVCVVGLGFGMHGRLGWPIWACRGLVEVTVLIAGWLLGGNVGIGTVLFAATIGPLVHVALPLLDSRRTPERVPART